MNIPSIEKRIWLANVFNVVALVLWVAHSASFAYRTSNRQVGGAIARLITKSLVAAGL